MGSETWGQVGVGGVFFSSWALKLSPRLQRSRDFNRSSEGAEVSGRPYIRVNVGFGWDGEIKLGGEGGFFFCALVRDRSGFLRGYERPLRNYESISVVRTSACTPWLARGPSASIRSAASARIAPVRGGGLGLFLCPRGVGSLLLGLRLRSPTAGLRSAVARTWVVRMVRVDRCLRRILGPRDASGEFL